MQFKGDNNSQSECRYLLNGLSNVQPGMNGNEKNGGDMK